MRGKGWVRGRVRGCVRGYVRHCVIGRGCVLEGVCMCVYVPAVMSDEKGRSKSMCSGDWGCSNPSGTCACREREGGGGKGGVRGCWCVK